MYTYCMDLSFLENDMENLLKMPLLQTFHNLFSSLFPFTFPLKDLMTKVDRKQEVPGM